MQGNGPSSSSSTASALDAETQEFVQRATAHRVNAEITRRLGRVSEREQERMRVEARVWWTALAIAAVGSVLLALFVLRHALVA